MNSGKAILAEASLCIDLAEKLKKGRFFAVLEDGTPFELKVTAFKPPFQMAPVSKKDLIGLLVGGG